jgi:hypothetical protein
MIVPSFARASLIALILAFGMVDRPQAACAALAILAVALAAAALTMPTSPGRSARLMPPVLIAILAAPALWMVT